MDVLEVDGNFLAVLQNEYRESHRVSHGVGLDQLSVSGACFLVHLQPFAYFPSQENQLSSFNRIAFV